MQLAVSTLNQLTEPIPIHEAVFNIAKTGIKLIEIRASIWANPCHYSYHMPEQTKELEKALKACAVKAVSFHPPIRCDLSALDSKEKRKAVDEFKYAMNIAAGLGAKNVVVHPGTKIEDADKYDRHRAQSMDSIVELFKYSREKGLALLLENMVDGCLCSNVVKLSEFIKDIGEPGIKVCLDIGHANLKNEVTSGLKVLKDRLAQLHISDNNGVEDQHLPPGEGRIDWDLFRTVLKEIEFNGPLIYEGYGGLMGIEKFKSEMRKLERIKNESEIGGLY